MREKAVSRICGDLRSLSVGANGSFRVNRTGVALTAPMA